MRIWAKSVELDAYVGCRGYDGMGRRAREQTYIDDTNTGMIGRGFLQQGEKLECEEHRGEMALKYRIVNR